MWNPLTTFGQKLLTPRGGLIAGLALILLGNAAVLARVAYNRTGEPEIWTFSEREFGRTWRYYYRRERENSGMTLHLDWRAAPPEQFDDTYLHIQRSLPLDRQQREALGYAADYDCGAPGHRRPDRIERDVWIALEYDGPAYRRHLAMLEQHLNEQIRDVDPEPAEAVERRIEQTRQRLDDLRHRDSRLYAVDLALDKAVLERRYRNNGRYLMLPALVTPRYECDRPTGVYIKRLFNTDIHVPKRHRAAFGRIMERNNRDSRPAFDVMVAYGRLNEPWLMEIKSGERRAD